VCLSTFSGRIASVNRCKDGLSARVRQAARPGRVIRSGDRPSARPPTGRAGSRRTGVYGARLTRRSNQHHASRYFIPQRGARSMLQNEQSLQLITF
jgi:hypothetical protein